MFCWFLFPSSFYRENITKLIRKSAETVYGLVLFQVRAFRL